MAQGNPTKWETGWLRVAWIRVGPTGREEMWEAIVRQSVGMVQTAVSQAGSGGHEDQIRNRSRVDKR